MNKLIACVVAVLALGTFSAVPAVGMKWGVDLFFTSTFGGGLRGNTGEFMGYNMSFETPSSGFGTNFFYDATYAELDIGLISGTLTQKGSASDGSSVEQPDAYAAFNLGALGKYPVALQENISLWPALGIDYSFVGMQWQEKSCNSMWIKFGAGADYGWKETMFLRTKLLYGIRMANEAENYFKDQSGGNKNVLGQGLDFGIGVGWYMRGGGSSKPSSGSAYD